MIPLSERSDRSAANPLARISLYPSTSQQLPGKTSARRASVTRRRADAPRWRVARRRCAEILIGWIRAVRSSRQPPCPEEPPQAASRRGGFLRMRISVNAIQDCPHGEERRRRVSKHARRSPNHPPQPYNTRPKAARDRGRRAVRASTLVAPAPSPAPRGSELRPRPRRFRPAADLPSRRWSSASTWRSPVFLDQGRRRAQRGNLDLVVASPAVDGKCWHRIALVPTTGCRWSASETAKFRATIASVDWVYIIFRGRTDVVASDAVLVLGRRATVRRAGHSSL